MNCENLIHYQCNNFSDENKKCRQYTDKKTKKHGLKHINKELIKCGKKSLECKNGWFGCVEKDWTSWAKAKKNTVSKKGKKIVNLITPTHPLVKNFLKWLNYNKDILFKISNELKKNPKLLKEISNHVYDSSGDFDLQKIRKIPHINTLFPNLKDSSTNSRKSRSSRLSRTSRKSRSSRSSKKSGRNSPKGGSRKIERTPIKNKQGIIGWLITRLFHGWMQMWESFLVGGLVGAGLNSILGEEYAPPILLLFMVLYTTYSLNEKVEIDINWNKDINKGDFVESYYIDKGKKSDETVYGTIKSIPKKSLSNSVLYAKSMPRVKVIFKDRDNDLIENEVPMNWIVNIIRTDENPRYIGINGKF